MINFHPTRQLLENHSAAELPLSLAIAVSAHIEMCPACQAQQTEIIDQQAATSWQPVSCKETSEQDGVENMVEDMFENMFDNIVAQKPQLASRKDRPTSVHTSVAGKTFKLPTALRAFTQLKWSGLGAISRARVNNDDGKTRSNLLHIDKNGSIPQHTHKGYELTLLLDGSFEDQSGVYNKGDFIWLNGDVEHSPFTKQGCLCYTVQDAPLHFITGISQVLNPLGNLIY
jgi:putative transcriptional regulator